jgi:hypothetical protein
MMEQDTERESVIEGIMQSVGRTRDGDLISDDASVMTPEAP